MEEEAHLLCRPLHLLCIRLMCVWYAIGMGLFRSRNMLKLDRQRQQQQQQRQRQQQR